MEFDFDPATRHLPQTELHSLAEVDAEADRVRTELGWSLACFVGVFDLQLDWALLVQLGDYTRKTYDGNVWSIPGGAVGVNELPSAAVIRELQEETGLKLAMSDLRPAGWLARPYYKPHFRDQIGELSVLFAAIANPDDAALRPAPPETLQCSFFPFDLEAFLNVPTRGEGEIPLQPLPRHWTWWLRTAQLALEDQLRSPVVWSYQSKDDLPKPPWEAPPIPSHWSRRAVEHRSDTTDSASA